ncbi:hypothetical protein PG994_008320 [Apiospora phragmitis]|uniref:Uncharacterized protein n=1 Tax=Apiospora phragmitis TaxID=2905665 RepID=A0ABR1UVU1_9PEZI
MHAPARVQDRDAITPVLLGRVLSPESRTGRDQPSASSRNSQPGAQDRDSIPILLLALIVLLCCRKTILAANSRILPPELLAPANTAPAVRLHLTNLGSVRSGRVMGSGHRPRVAHVVRQIVVVSVIFSLALALRCFAGQGATLLLLGSGTGGNRSRGGRWHILAIIFVGLFLVLGGLHASCNLLLSGGAWESRTGGWDVLPVVVGIFLALEGSSTSSGPHFSLAVTIVLTANEAKRPLLSPGAPAPPPGYPPGYSPHEGQGCPTHSGQTVLGGQPAPVAKTALASEHSPGSEPPFSATPAGVRLLVREHGPGSCSPRPVDAAESRQRRTGDTAQVQSPGRSGFRLGALL